MYVNLPTEGRVGMHLLPVVFTETVICDVLSVCCSSFNTTVESLITNSPNSEIDLTLLINFFLIWKFQCDLNSYHNINFTVNFITDYFCGTR